ncbi:hypothetical protein ABB02_00065 [Clostridiaceae bacterium JG1575]|nr:hypothetical protein ABB02_00065 [Clostridiaceae bacterium JG1575]
MEKLFLSSKDVADILNVSQQKAYQIIRELNVFGKLNFYQRGSLFSYHPCAVG